MPNKLILHKVMDATLACMDPNGRNEQQLGRDKVLLHFLVVGIRTERLSHSCSDHNNVYVWFQP
jgi:hypothetical protein